MKNKRRNKSPFEQFLDEVEGKEEFHHFDGDDEFEYDDEYVDEFDDEDFDNVTGSVKHQRKLFKANPYQIIVHNPSTRPLKAVIYGHDKFLLKPNFGSDAGILISTGQSGVDYVELLQRSSTHQFKTQHLRIESDNLLQLSKPMMINEMDAAGSMIQRPLNLNIYKSPYQYSDKILDIDDNLPNINGSTYIAIEVEPTTRILLSFFPLYEINTSRTLKGNDPIKAFAPAKVNSASISIRPKRLVPKLRRPKQ